MKMAKLIAFIVLGLLLIVMLSGCTGERRVTFKNMSTDVVFERSVKFATMRGWKVFHSNPATKTVSAILQDMGNGQTATLNVTISENGSDSDVYLRAETLHPFYFGIGSYWNTDVTFDEYVRFVEEK